MKILGAALALFMSLSLPGSSLAQSNEIDTRERKGTLEINIDLKGTEKPQPYSLGLDGQPVKNSKGEYISASIIDAVDYNRQVKLKIPLYGYLGGGSGFQEVDSQDVDTLNKDFVPPTNMPEAGQQDIASLQAAIGKCGDNEACMMDAIRNLGEAMQAKEAVTPDTPKNMPIIPNLQRYLGMTTRPDLNTGKCGTALVLVNDHHVGKSMDSVAGWINFDYYQKGEQNIPSEDTFEARLCGSRFALDYDKKVYHLKIAGVSISAKTIRTDFPHLPAVPVSVLGDAEPKLLFLNQSGTGPTVSISPFEIKNFYYVTGTQGQKIPLDAVVSWTINVDNGGGSASSN